ncbi:MAG TPA: VCBS repeat-containing protein [Silvibacterium sp.]|nr:VCBS repeat-containing protein [Silvibacterium sp.]
MKTDLRFPVLITVVPLVVAAAVLLARGGTGSSSNGEAAGAALDFDERVIPVGRGPGSIAIADVNHDGKLDIIVANSVDGTLSVLLGDSKGHFIPAAGSPIACGTGPNDIATGDFNGDGNLDLVTANTETPYLTILLGDGKGGFAPSPHSPFDTHSYPHVHGVAIGDFNADGKLDAVTDSWGHNQILMFLGDGAGNLILPGQAFKTGKRPYQRLRSADFNKDGKPDVVTTDLDENAVAILLGDGKGGLHDAPGSPFPAGRAPWAVAIDDMNHDGNLDLVIIPYARDVPDSKDVGVTVLLGDGKGGFRKMPDSPFSLAGCEGPDRVATGDINGDGLRDIVVTCAQNNRLMLYLGSRDGGFSISTRRVQTGWAGVAVAELAGRGKDDIVVSNGVLDNQPKPANGTITILSSK